jgi:S-adenosylmethionine synthetase
LTQHDDFDEEATMLAKIKKDIVTILIPRIIKKPNIRSFIQ